MADDSDGHEFLPGSISQQITDSNVDYRKKGLFVVDAAVRNYIRSLKNKNINDDTLNNTVIRFLNHVKTKFIDNTDPNYRIGGLMAVACTALALDEYLDRFNNEFIKMALSSFYDQDQKSLYNIMKKSKGGSLQCIDELFDGICKLSCDPDDDVKYASQILNRLLCDVFLECKELPVEMIIDILASRIFVINPFIRQLIVSWIVTLNSIPTINMIDHLPKLFLGLSNMLIDINKDVRNSAESCMNELLLLLKKSYSSSASTVLSEELFKVILLNSKRTEHLIRLPTVIWVREIANLQPLIVHFKGFSQLLSFIIKSIADNNSAFMPLIDVAKIAHDANRILFTNVRDVLKTITYIDDLTIALTEVLDYSNEELVILATLEWICLMLELNPSGMVNKLRLFSKSVIYCFKQSQSEKIMSDVLRALVLIVSLGDEHLELLAQDLLEFFKHDKKLLEEYGRVIILNVCMNVGFEKFYRVITKCINNEMDKQFLQQMIHSLNWTLLTSEEAETFRAELLTGKSSEISTQLQNTWLLGNLSSALSFSLWIENYTLSNEIIKKIAESALTLDFLLNLDKVVQLLDSHIFTRLRLHLLSPREHPNLLKALLGLFMILPQSETNQCLMRRLQMLQLTMLQELLSKK